MMIPNMKYYLGVIGCYGAVGGKNNVLFRQELGVKAASRTVVCVNFEMDVLIHVNLKLVLEIK